MVCPYPGFAVTPSQIVATSIFVRTCGVTAGSLVATRRRHGVTGDLGFDRGPAAAPDARHHDRDAGAEARDAGEGSQVALRPQTTGRPDPRSAVSGLIQRVRPGAGRISTLAATCIRA